jgi:adenine-specific DNA-methyltransferase
MGMLQQMVHILSRLDPKNEQWKSIMMDDAIAATSDAYRNSNDEERKEVVADIERSFDEAINRPDYARKLYLIENCIYGVDIQPIAIQISKLRFFISLVVDQITNTDATDNFGIRTLPNLEAKFVAANTLIGLDKKDTSLFDSDLIRQKEKEMAIAKHKIFGAKTVKTKRKYKEQVKTIRLEIATMLKENGIVGNDEALRLKEWDMFDQNTSSFFFDSEWMFDIKDGFDIVIGNPPYGVINKKQNKGESITATPEISEHYKKDSIYKHAQGGMLNIFRLFIVKSINLLTNDGVFSEIFPLAFTCDISSSKLREYTIKKSSIISIDAFPERDDPKKRVFENAKMSVCIMLLKKKIQDDTTFNLRINRNRYVSLEKEPSQISYLEIKQIDDKYKTIPLTEKKDTELIMKIYQESQKFSSYGKCNTGEIDMTFCKDAFIYNNNSYRMLRGANIDRYTSKTNISQGENLYIDNDILHSIKKINDKLFYSERIVMQGITGVNERVRLKMNLIKDAYCANSTNYLTFKNEVNPKFFLALFNSKLMNYVFKQFSTNSNVNGYEVENLPIRINLPDQITHIVDSIIKAKSIDISANTSDLESQIDLLVYKLYGLSYDEIKTVDPETPITNEEYEED